MRHRIHTFLQYLLMTLFVCILPWYVTGCTGSEESEQLAGDILDIVLEEVWDDSQEDIGSSQQSSEIQDSSVDEDGAYYSKEDVSLYIHIYGHLPDNYITKSEAGALGWEGGSVEVYSPGSAIGGDRFGNYEGLLPDKEGRTYYECDIDTDGGKSRGAKRIIFSDDGLIYYTDDHYESFTLLYGEEE